MKKRYLSILLALVLFIGVMVYGAIRVPYLYNSKRAPIPNVASTLVGVATSATDTVVSTKLKQLVDAYPDFLTLDPNATNSIVWKQDGTRMTFDDGVVGKLLEMMMAHPDLEDQLSMPYETGEQVSIRTDVDPGRVRYEPLFEKMYGGTEGAVKAHLVTVYWLPHHGNQPLLVTRVNGVNEKLQAISNELDALVDEPGQAYLLPYLENPGGTFKWRTVQGTDRLSPHSFGIAMDINTARSDYFEWASSGALMYKNQIPLPIVHIFEKRGFIWGGKWYHFDTMHFEYRPELFSKSE
jgi:peptidoglycan LD-endopeptidase CwlK